MRKQVYWPQQQRLIEKQFSNVSIWSRGVDRILFHPRDKNVIVEDGPSLEALKKASSSHFYQF
jgi:hypothetical protein